MDNRGYLTSCRIQDCYQSTEPSGRKRKSYELPPYAYYETVWLIKGYYWMQELIENIILATPSPDGQPRGNGIADPTYAKAVKLGKYPHIIRVIDEERERIDEYYRKGVWDSIMYDKVYPFDADRRTYSRHKRNFVYNVAVRLGIYADES